METPLSSCQSCGKNFNGSRSREDPNRCFLCYLIQTLDNSTYTGNQPPISCYACDGNITSEYRLICQSRSDYERGLDYLICSPRCSKALEIFGAECSSCRQIYIHNRYDGWICDYCADTETDSGDS